MAARQRRRVGRDAVERADCRAVRADCAPQLGEARRQQKRPGRALGNAAQATMIAIGNGALVA
ncbi:hypothetical protein SE17_41460, partial [Kouleothrix aurantiaca]